VALTRAKRLCYVSWGWVNEAETSPLHYLLHCRDAGPSMLGDGAGLEATLRDRWGALTASSLARDLASLEASSGGAVAVRPADREAPVGPPPAEPEVTTEARVFDRSAWNAWCITSYSGLTRGRHRDAPERDRDTMAATGGEGAGQDIFGFPRGAAAGIFLHELLQNTDFRAAGEPAHVALLTELCRDRGYDPSWVPVLADMSRGLAGVPLVADGRALTLAAIGPKDRVTELEFHLPVGRLDPFGLASAFASGGYARLAPVLAALGFGELRGFLQGFVDLVFRSEGRYYIADWKSNYIGPTIEDYGPEPLARVMRENLYELQLALYTVALHRYLGRRIREYDYEKHVGGVFYVFLRGVRAATPDRGIYFARPRVELVRGVEAMLGAADG